MMTEDENYFDENAEKNKTAVKNLNKAIAILFVGAIYFVIFLKILFIE